MHQKDKTQFWILSLNPEFCTVDDLKLGRHGFVYDGVLNSIGVKEGDVAILFDSHARSFKKIDQLFHDTNPPRWNMIASRLPSRNADSCSLTHSIPNGLWFFLVADFS